MSRQSSPSTSSRESGCSEISPLQKLWFMFFGTATAAPASDCSCVSQKADTLRVVQREKERSPIETRHLYWEMMSEKEQEAFVRMAEAVPNADVKWTALTREERALFNSLIVEEDNDS